MLQYHEERHQLVQLRHTVSGGTLVGQYDYGIGCEFAPVEGVHKTLLRIENTGSCMDTMVLGFHGGSLDDSPAEVALYQAQAPLVIERLVHRSQDTGIQRLIHYRLPANGTIFKHRFAAVIVQALTHDGANVIVQ